MLFTGDFVTAQDAFRLGMINHIVRREELEAKTPEIAAKIAGKPSFGLSLIKELVNNVEDTAGRLTNQRAHFAAHHLLHWHNVARHRVITDPIFYKAAALKEPEGKEGK